MPDERAHATNWLMAWNAHDLAEIMSLYADDVEFVAPTVVTRWNRDRGRLSGKIELRSHFERGLELAPALVFTEEAFLLSPGGYALLYRRDNGNRCLDVVELDEHGLAARVRAFYESEQA
jgi:hypothetical protein